MNPKEILKKYGFLYKVYNEEEYRKNLIDCAQKIIDLGKNFERDVIWLAEEYLKETFSLWQQEIYCEKMKCVDLKRIGIEEFEGVFNVLHEKIRFGYVYEGSKIKPRFYYDGSLQKESLEAYFGEKVQKIEEVILSMLSEETKLKLLFDDGLEKNILFEKLTYIVDLFEERLKLDSENEKMKKELISFNEKIIREFFKNNSFGG